MIKNGDEALIRSAILNRVPEDGEAIAVNTLVESLTATMEGITEDVCHRVCDAMVADGTLVRGGVGTQRFEGREPRWKAGRFRRESRLRSLEEVVQVKMLRRQCIGIVRWKRFRDLMLVLRSFFRGGSLPRPIATTLASRRNCTGMRIAIAI